MVCDAVASSASSSTSPIRRLSPGDRLVREDAGARHQRAVAAAIAAPEQLVAAAYGEECGPGLDGSAEVVPTGGEIGRDERLLAILAAADVDEVERPRLQLVTRLDSGHLERMTAQRRAAGEALRCCRGRRRC